MLLCTASLPTTLPRPRATARRPDRMPALAESRFTPPARRRLSSLPGSWPEAGTALARTDRARASQIACLKPRGVRSRPDAAGRTAVDPVPHVLQRQRQAVRKTASLSVHP